MNKYELAYYANEENTYFDRFTSRESALLVAHNLAYKGFSSVITDIESGEVIDEVIVH